MRIFLPTALLLTSLSAPLAEAQVKRGGGLFGFNKNSEQISAGLFPNDAPAAIPVSTTSQPTSTAPAPEPSSSSGGDAIFRNGSPQEVGEVSYTIEGADTAIETVAKPEKTKKRGSFFSFGKKSDPPPTQPVIDPVPPSTASPAPVQEASQQIESTVSEAVTTAENASADAMETAGTVAAPPSIPTFEQPVKESKGGFMSFFSRKKKDTADLPANSATPEMPNVVATEDGVYEVTNPNQPTLTASNEPDRNGGLLPIGKNRGEKKSAPIDMTGAETIIQNGEIVAPDDNGFTANVAPQGNGVKDPPKVINGVKTYSSWEDVEAAPVSAADKILKQIR